MTSEARAAIRVAYLDGEPVEEIARKSLAAMILASRIAHGWSLREAARKTGVPNAHISQIETGAIRKPSQETLVKLALGYSLPLGEMLEAAGYASIGPARVVGPGTLRAEFVRLLTTDSVTSDARRRDFNQALFMTDGQPAWTETTLDMVMGKFDKAVRNLEWLVPSEAKNGSEEARGGG